MNIDKKSKIFITVSFFLLIGLVLAVFLSFQVMQDTKTSVLPPEESIPQSKVDTAKPPSIYDIEIPFSSAPTEIAVPKQEEKIIEKKKAMGTVSNVKTIEQEQAELSAGLQDKYDSSLESAPTSAATISRGSTDSTSDTGDLESSATKVNQPNEEQIRDLQKKGIIIF